MDLYTVNNFDYKLYQPISRWCDTVIWTERYQKPGEIEIRSYDVDIFRDLCPTRSLVTSTQRNDVFLIETHNIKRDQNGVAQLIVKGRTADAFLEHRVIGGRSGKRYRMPVQMYDPAEAAATLIWNSFVNTTTVDVSRNAATDKYEVDALYNTIVTISTNRTMSNRQRWVRPGPVDAQVRAFLKNANLGLRVIKRGVDYNNTTEITVRTGSTVRGALIKTPKTGASDKLRFDIYDGKDLYQNSDPVKFVYTAGHLTASEHLRSVQNWKTWVWGESDNGRFNKYRNNTQFNYGGWDRRVMYVDAGGPGEGETAAEFNDELADIGTENLDNTRQIRTFDANVTPSAPYVYGEDADYYLGDQVILVDDYGAETVMRVVEHITTSDKNGITYYPALAVDEEE